jgi:hypothetical protein
MEAIGPDEVDEEELKRAKTWRDIRIAVHGGGVESAKRSAQEENPQRSFGGPEGHGACWR